MPSNENTLSSQTCEFCGAQIPENSTKCGHCVEWRKDIKQLRIKFFVSLALLFIVCAITFIGALDEWWQRIEVTHSSIEFWGSKLPITDTKYYSFSLKTFFSSFSGISLFILICTFSYLSFLYGSLLKKKIGTLW
jgi:predicted nucleic acid-binding Zn ribbon protein